MSMSITGIGLREELLIKLWNTRSNYLKHEVLNPATYKRPVTLLSHKPRLFALLVGIDHYRTVRPLRGAVADVLAFKDYLETHLSVPPAQITALLNGSATRVEIIRQLTRIKHSDKIVKGDAIMIYFAGHGGEVTYVDDPQHTSQFIIPQDYSSNPKGRIVPAIPLQTIASLTTKIAEIKGDNITLILDCSYAYPTTPAESAKTPSTFRIRAVPLPPSIHPPSLDKNIWREKRTFKKTSVNPFEGDAHPYMMIQACSSSECAHEITRGEFSRSLLNLLRNVSPHELRYSDITNHIDQIPSQTPRVQGPYQQRPLFNGLVLVTHQTAFHISKTKARLMLHAGTVNGVTEGAEFTVYQGTDTSFEKPLGRLGIGSLGAFSSELAFPDESAPFEIGEDALAIQTKTGSRGDVRFYFPMDDRLLPCYEAYLTVLRNGGKDVNQITLVDDPRDAHIEVAVEDNRAVFIMRDEQVTQHGLTRLPHNCALTPDEMFDVMKAAAHYYWKFNRVNNNPDINNNIKLEFHELEDITTDTDSLGVTKFAPCGPNLCRNGVVEMVVEEDVPYGLSLTNNSSFDLYPYLFYFDSSDLSIGTYYNPIIDCRISGPPLKRNGGTLTIGYGNGGGHPFAYYLPKGQNYDLGFLKLFFTTKPVDLSGIPQPTPFEAARSRSGENEKPTADTWGTCIVPVLQYQSGDKNHCPQCGYITPYSLYEHTAGTLAVQNGDVKLHVNANHEHQTTSPLNDAEHESQSSGRLCTECELYNKNITDLKKVLEPPPRGNRKAWWSIFLEKLLSTLHIRPCGRESRRNGVEL